MLFVVLAYALSALWVVPLAVTGHPVVQGRGWPTHLPSLMSPLVAAVVVTARTRGRAGLWLLGAAMTRYRFGPRWWAATLSPIAWFCVGLAVLAATGTMPPARDFAGFSGLPADVGVVGLLAVLVLVNGYGEETGWRGFALPRLQRRFGPVTATLVVAVIWAGWHVPQFFVLASYEQFRSPMLLVFVVGLTGGSVVTAWLYNRTGGSVLAVAVWHGLYNGAGATAAATGGVGVLSAVVWTLVVGNAVVLLVLERRARRLGRPSVIGMRPAT